MTQRAVPDLLRPSVLGFFLILGMLSGAGPSAAEEFPDGIFPARDEFENRFRETRALEKNDPRKAAETYRTLLKVGFPLPDALHAGLARVLPLKEAKGHWQAVADTVPPSPYLPEALEGLAEWHAANGSLAEAVNLYSQLARSTEDDEVAVRCLLRSVELLDRQEKGPEALNLAETVWVDYAHVPESQPAGEYLAKATGDPFRPVTAERILRRGQVLFQKGRREEALRTLGDLKRRLVPGSEIEPEVDLALGKALYYLRRYEDALEALQRARVVPEMEEEARFYRARSLFGLNRGDEGAADLVELAQQNSGSPRAPLYLYQAFRVFEGREMWAEAKRAKTRLRNQFPKTQEALEVRWAEGWEDYRREMFLQAASAFQTTAELAEPGWMRARGLYWEGRALRAAGEKSGANAALKALLDEYPLGFYATLARSIQVANAPTLGLGDPRRLPRGPLPFFRPERQDVTPGEDLARAAAYLRLGLNEPARRLLRAGGGSGLSWARASYWAEDFHGAVRASGRSWMDWPAHGNPAPMELEGLAYPIAYPRTAARVTREAGIHPHLLLAVAHTESHFDPKAYSTAEARGIMQFIPATGAATARDLGIDDFEPEDLFEPHVALRLGAWHLRDLLDRFEGDVVAAIAAYNAGASAVRRWREQVPVEPIDVFVEAIPYRETRRYVKKVVTALDAYGRLDPPGLLTRDAP